MKFDEKMKGAVQYVEEKSRKNAYSDSLGLLAVSKHMELDDETETNE